MAKLEIADPSLRFDIDVGDRNGVRRHRGTGRINTGWFATTAGPWPSASGQPAHYDFNKPFGD